MLPSRIPVHPFQLVSADIFQFAGVHFLLLVPQNGFALRGEAALPDVNGHY
jgi:hypothetical protein